MKRVLPILLSLVLVISLAVPVFASSYEDVFDSSAGSYRFVVDFGGTLMYYHSPNPFYLKSDGFLYTENNTTYYYRFADGTKWDSYTTPSGQVMDFRNSSFLYANYDVLDEYGNIVYTSNPFCDGSSCPANDLDHNNICDDCERVLTMSLRSTLLSYVQTLAEDYSSGYPYYAVFENVLGGLNLYLSKAPITIDGEDYYHVVGTSGQWSRATTDDDGVHSHGVFASWSSPTGGTLVYANHEIENFRMPPLAVVIQGVTEGELMEVTVPNLAKVIKILVPCGVGCLALLIVLSLFGKRSLISRN